MTLCFTVLGFVSDCMYFSLCIPWFSCPFVPLCAYDFATCCYSLFVPIVTPCPFFWFLDLVARTTRSRLGFYGLGWCTLGCPVVRGSSCSTVASIALFGHARRVNKTPLYSNLRTPQAFSCKPGEFVCLNSYVLYPWCGQYLVCFRAGRRA
jgi:hypothetical protein